MVTFKKMGKQDIPLLYHMAVRAFAPDYEKYGVYPPLLKTGKKSFLPPLVFGKVILLDGVAVGGFFATALGKRGELGAIFIDPQHQGKGIGRQTMAAIEKLHPKVRRWKLDTPSENVHLHRFYESLGYVKVGERKDPKSGMTGFVYEKTV